MFARCYVSFSGGVEISRRTPFGHAPLVRHVAKAKAGRLHDNGAYLLQGSHDSYKRHMQLPVGFLPSQPAPTISPTHLPDMPTIALVDTSAHESLGSIAQSKLEEYIGRDQVRCKCCRLGLLHAMLTSRIAYWPHNIPIALSLLPRLHLDLLLTVECLLSYTGHVCVFCRCLTSLAPPQRKSCRTCLITWKS